MRFALVALILAVAPVAFAEDTTDARDRPEMKHQIRQVNKDSREKRLAARARVHAKKLETRAAALRGEDGKK
jgi:hypothetical protein